MVSIATCHKRSEIDKGLHEPPLYYSPHIKSPQGPVAQWIRHRPTEPGIAGSSPVGVIVVSEKHVPILNVIMFAESLHAA